MSDYRNRDNHLRATARVAFFLAAFALLAVCTAAVGDEVVTIKFTLSPSVQSAMVDCRKLAAKTMGTPPMREASWGCMAGGAMVAPPKAMPNGDMAIEHVCYVATREPVDLSDVAALSMIGHEVFFHCLRGLRHE